MSDEHSEERIQTHDPAASSGAGVYLLHLEGPSRTLGHYIGYGSFVRTRIAKQVRGTGASFVKKMLRLGGAIVVGRIWEGEGKDFESMLKRQKNARKFCRVCAEFYAEYPARSRGVLTSSPEARS